MYCLTRHKQHCWEGSPSSFSATCPTHTFLFLISITSSHCESHLHTHTHTHDNVYIYSLTQIAHFDITLSMLQFVTDSVLYHYLPLNRSEKLGLCLLSNTCMSLGLQVMFTAELAGPGVQWDTIGTAPTTSDNLHLGHVTAMLAVDTVLYMIIAWYVGV